MPEIVPNHVPSLRTLLAWDSAAGVYRPIHVDALGNVQIDVVAMDPLAATAANQALILAQLQLIEDMRDALQSVNTDALQVRGEDQLWTYDVPLGNTVAGAISGAGGYIESGTPAVGDVWVVTGIAAYDGTSPVTRMGFVMRRGGVSYDFHYHTAAIPTGEPHSWEGFKWIENGDTIRAHFTGALAGDTCVITVTGHIMGKE